MTSRTSRTMPNRRVLVHGMHNFGRMFADLMNGDGWEFCYYRDKGIGNFAAMARALQRCDLIYQIGGRVNFGKFLRAARLMGKRRIVMHWVGSDTILGQKEFSDSKSDQWVAQNPVHWAETPWMVQEVERLGLRCELVPLPSARVPEAPSPLPPEFSVLLYVPDMQRASFYGLDWMLQVAKELPHIRFDLVGLENAPLAGVPRNFHNHGRISDLSDFMQRSAVLWRPVQHDGLSLMVLEALGHGRHVLWTYEFPGCIAVKSAQEARDRIAELHEKHKRGDLEINHVGAQVVAESYLPRKLRGRIRARLDEILES